MKTIIREVTIMYFAHYDNANVVTDFSKDITIGISEYCPICGKQRGKAFNTEYSIYDNTIVDKWVNHCGHVDTYEELYKESENYG